MNNEGSEKELPRRTTHRRPRERWEPDCRYCHVPLTEKTRSGLVRTCKNCAGLKATQKTETMLLRKFFKSYSKMSVKMERGGLGTILVGSQVPDLRIGSRVGCFSPLELEIILKLTGKAVYPGFAGQLLLTVNERRNALRLINQAALACVQH